MHWMVLLVLLLVTKWWKTLLKGIGKDQEPCDFYVYTRMCEQTLMYLVFCM
jgi:hypothetical protein